MHGRGSRHPGKRQVSVRKAIIPAAGLATRFLPVTKVVPKELLPLGNKPVIHWIVEEAVAAGVDEVVIVISDDKTAICEYFTANPSLDAVLRQRGKGELLDEVNQLIDNVRFTFVIQDEPKGLGHAVLCGRDAVGDDPALVLLGDAPIMAQTPVSRQLVDMYEEVGHSVIGLERVANEKIPFRGIVGGIEETPTRWHLNTVIEKPALADAPSNLSISGRYLFTPGFFQYIETATPRPDGEICLTTAIDGLIRDAEVYGCVFEGTRHDTGTPAGYRDVLEHYA